MAITSKDGILKILMAYNPWWKTGVINPKMTKTYKRFAFHEAMKRLNEKDIRRTVVLTGTRRVGKTTIRYAQDWDRWLKIIYDNQPDTSAVATGSASPALMKGNRESGADRRTVIQVLTLSFYEYCELLGVDRPDIPPDLKVISFLHKTQIERTQIMLRLSKVQNHFIDTLLQKRDGIIHKNIVEFISANENL